MNLLVPTRNNHAGLASMLASFLAVTHHARGNSAVKTSLYLMDSSDEPVITNPHLARLLTCFDLQYSHFVRPHVNDQRLCGLTRIAQGESNAQVLISDDDHVFVEDPTKAYDDFAVDKTAKAYFGVAVDVMNDKGFKDFQTHTPTGGHHSFALLSFVPARETCPSLRERTANPGLLICRASEAAVLLGKFNAAHYETPAVADDAWARSLADPPYLHTSLAALHIGNNNKWWNSWDIKHEAVTLAMKGTDAAGK